MTDHYATLGVTKLATHDEIRTAYRKMASVHHPDKESGNKEKFQEIQAAYGILGDIEKRAQYDNPPSPFSRGPTGFQFNTSSGGVNDMFNQMFRQSRQQQQHTPFVRMSLWIQLHDVATGGKRPVAIGGNTGTSTIEIDIPMGINDGDSVQYQGLAPGGGDLVIQFRIHPNATWQRSGLDLITEHNASIWDMILGSDISVKTITGGELTTTMQPNTQPRTVLRLRQHGLKDSHGRQGDILIRVSPVIPQDIAPEIIAAIKLHRK